VTSILPENDTDENKAAKTVINFFKEQQISKTLRQANFTKERGVPLCQRLLLPVFE
jgi:hypothetical protein